MWKPKFGRNYQTPWIEIIEIIEICQKRASTSTSTLAAVPQCEKANESVVFSFELCDASSIDKMENQQAISIISLVWRFEGNFFRFFFLAHKKRIRGTNVQHVFFVTNEIRFVCCWKITFLPWMAYVCALCLLSTVPSLSVPQFISFSLCTRNPKIKIKNCLSTLLLLRDVLNNTKCVACCVHYSPYAYALSSLISSNGAVSPRIPEIKGSLREEPTFKQQSNCKLVFAAVVSLSLLPSRIFEKKKKMCWARAIVAYHFSKS